MFFVPSQCMGPVSSDASAKQPRNRSGILARIVAAIAIGLVSGVGRCLADNIVTPATTPQQQSMLAQMQDAFTSIADSVEPTVVNIKSERFRPEEPGDGGDNGEAPSAPEPKQKGGKSPLPPSMPMLPHMSPRIEATGSGVIIRSDGYILTNDHVVYGASNGIVTVTLSDGRQFKGKVYEDYRSDLAVVKIDPGATELPVATFADSSLVHPGQWAIAVGSPFDLENTMTVGVISAIGRHQQIPGDSSDSARYYPQLIQTDAAINPGNSGGPLFNLYGQVVGINVAIESPVEGSAGIGFAIPSDTAQEIMQKLITTGSVTRGFLGVAPDDLTPAIKQEFSQPTGAFVRDVQLTSPAGLAGLQAADIITQFDGQPVTGEVSLRELIGNATPGKKVKVVYVRNGVPAVTTVVLTVAPAVGEATQPTKPASAPETPKLGLMIRDLTPSDRAKLGYPADTQGVYIASVAQDSIAEEAGIPPGSVLQEIGKLPIRHPADVTAAMRAAINQSEVTLVILHGEPGALHQTAATVHF